MNKVILIGRLVREPEIRYTQGSNPTAVAKYSLAVPRKFKREGEPDCDFINCVAFGKSAEFAEKYLRKGTKIAVVGRLRADSYINKDGQKVYTTDVVVEEQEFCESRQQQQQEHPKPSQSTGDGWMNIPDGIDDSELPFQ